jgi:hypothetical protein
LASTEASHHLQLVSPLPTIHYRRRPVSTKTNPQQAQPSRQPTGVKIINVVAASTTAKPATRSRGEEDETQNKLTPHEGEQREAYLKKRNKNKNQLLFVCFSPCCR